VIEPSQLAGALQCREKTEMQKDEKIPPFLTEITERIVSTSDPDKVILFGSYARGDFGPDSDLDLLVIKNQVDSIHTEVTRLYRALADFKIPIDIDVVRQSYVDRYGGLVGTVVRPALREGKVLNAR
jgi:predicted nucleotidyltransferase